MAVAKTHGLECEEPIVLADRSNVIVHLHPAPVVARVATTAALVRPDARAWLEREIAVASFLAERGVAVVTPSDELSPGPHQHNDLALSFWKHIESDPDRVPSNDEIGRSLAELHTVLREYPNKLPYLDQFFGEVQKVLDYLESSAALEQNDVALLRGVYENLGGCSARPVGVGTTAARRCNREQRAHDRRRTSLGKLRGHLQWHRRLGLGVCHACALQRRSASCIWSCSQPRGIATVLGCEAVANHGLASIASLPLPTV